MKPLRTLVIDDEPLARSRMRSMLARRNDITVLAECCDGNEALVAIQEHQPDLIFLDIQMPELDGFQVVQALDPEFRPIIVFVTAYNEHAVKAFEVNAMDYLLKPYDDQRLGKSIDRACQILAERESENLPAEHEFEFEQRLVHVMDQLKSNSYLQRLAVKSGDRLHLVKTDHVEWFEAAGNYIRIHCVEKQYLMRESMKSLFSKLDPNQFVRIHRSTIVNVDQIDSFEPTFHGDYQVCLKNGQRLPLSRNYRTELRAKFGEQI